MKSGVNMCVNPCGVKEPADAVVPAGRPMIPAVACFRLLRKGARIISGIAGAALVTLLIVNWELVPIFCPKTGEAWMNAPITAVRAPWKATFVAVANSEKP